MELLPTSPAKLVCSENSKGTLRIQTEQMEKERGAFSELQEEICSFSDESYEVTSEYTQNKSFCFFGCVFSLLGYPKNG